MKYLRYIYILFFMTGVSLWGEPYVVGRIMGQLGNQMFIIAATCSLAWEHGAKPVFPDLESEIDWNVPENRRVLFSHLNTKLPRHVDLTTYKEKAFHYQPIPYRENILLHGYFQSEKYFKKYQERICQLFAPPEGIQSYLAKKYETIIAHPKTVAIHFRDYLEWQRWHPNCTKQYFKKAIAHFNQDMLFVVFSNNPQQCKKLFQGIPRNFIFIEGEHFHHDFYLMSQCKHHIISNSSFSWWAAYLNQNPEKKVIAPKRWFASDYHTDTYDVCPEGWIRL